jgi:hypothetical protein
VWQPVDGVEYYWEFRLDERLIGMYQASVRTLGVKRINDRDSLPPLRRMGLDTLCDRLL